MRRILLDDVDAAVYHFKKWQSHLHTAEFAVGQFQDYGVSNELLSEAECAKEKALDILRNRYGVNKYEFLGIDKHAREAARQEHNLRTTILSGVWRYLDRNKPPEQALEIFMEPEHYAMYCAMRARQR